MADTRNSDVERTIADFIRNPILAHRTVFKHRHPQVSPDYHARLIELYHSDNPRVLAEIFRGGAKSTLAEETIVLKGCTRQCRNCVILGENEDRAKERLRSVRHEFEMNEFILELFGDLKGEIWGETKILLSNGIMIQCYGRGQALRGAKHLDQRPDWVFADDLEDAESVLTDESRRKTSEWWWTVVVPGLDSPMNTPVRVAGTPLHDASLLVELSKTQEFRKGFIKVPISYVDEAGAKQSSWPARFPLLEIAKLEEAYYKSGNADKFQQEYMCEVVDPAQKVFTQNMFVHDPKHTHTYQPVYAIYDPARTVKATSARTGKVVASWVSNKLVVWEAAASLWKPDEIIADMFDMDDRYRPIAIGVEEDGLNEFILQPLRHEQVKRGHPIPVRALKAPRGKFDFIRSLQPFFKAGEVVFAGDPESFSDLAAQLLNFRPGYTGVIDAANALAYFLKVRPGHAVLDGFGLEHVMEDMNVERSPCYLGLSYGHGYLCGVVAQFRQGRLGVLADYLREGDAGIEVERLVGDARLEAAGSGYPLRVVASRQHFDQYDNTGLRAGCAAIPVDLRRGGDEARGRLELQSLIEHRIGAMPSLRVSGGATWTLRALSGGYARKLDKHGVLSKEPEDNVYATLMRALESLVSLTTAEADDTGLTFDYTPDGRRYITARR